MLINIHSLIVSHHRQLVLLSQPKMTTDEDMRTHAGAPLAVV